MTRIDPDLTIAQVAAQCGVHHRTVRSWIKTGKLAAYRQAGHGIRVRQPDVDKLRQPIATARRSA